MMSEINLQDLESSVVADPVVVTADKLEQELESDLPEKYRGKSVKEIAKMHQEAEQAFSRQGNELGEYRRLADTLLGLEQEKKTKEKGPETVPVTTDDLFSDTEKSLNRAVEQNPVVKKVAETSEALERELNITRFEREFPGYKQDLENPEFGEWIKKSAVRLQLAKAANDYDLESARGLWQLWGEYSEFQTSKEEVAEKARKKAESQEKRRKQEDDADLEGSTTGDGTSETVYDRKKVMELRIRALKGDKSAEAKLKKLNPLRVYTEGRIR